MKTNISIFIILLALSFSCQKKELEPSVLTLLTNNDVKSWQIIEVRTEGINAQPCRNDDIFVFSLFDEELELPYWQIQDNFVACTDSYVALDGFWRINNQGDRLTLTTGRPDEGGNINFLYHIESITETELQLRIDLEDLYGFTLTNEYITLRRL